MANMIKNNNSYNAKMQEFSGVIDDDAYGVPTEEIICEALKTKDFSRLDNCIVVAYSHSRYLRHSTENPRHVRFKEDIWSNRYVRTAINEGLRSVNFTTLKCRKFRLEVKIISACILWVTGKAAKTHSALRKCSNIVIAARIVESLGYDSFSYLKSELVRNEFISKLREPDENGQCRSERTLRNYLMDLNDICLLGHTSLKEYGFSLDIRFTNYKNQDDANQTYCMPFRLMMSIWKNMIEELDAEMMQLDFEHLSKISNLINGYYTSKYYSPIRNLDDGYAYGIGDRRSNYYYSVREQMRSIYDELNPHMQNLFSFESNNRWKNKIVCIDHGKLYNWHQKLTLMVITAIQMMSGMRRNEALGVQHGSLIYDGEFIGLRSVLHKYAPEGGVKEDWVVCNYIEKPFIFLRNINLILTRINEKDLDSVPLSFNIAKWFTQRRTYFMGTQRINEWSRDFVERHHIVITKEDYEEFQYINPNIRNGNKVNRDITIGGFWPLRSHQFRRSLAVHLRRLDLVTAGDLANQFKHLGWGITEWYMSGALEANHFSRIIPNAFAAELIKTELESSSNRAVMFQHEGKLAGQGGKILMSERDKPSHLQTFPTLKKAMSMAKRGGRKLVSLGNGFYCMNGNECDFKPIIQSSACNPACPNMIAGADSVPFWKTRLTHYGELIDIAINTSASQADIDFLTLERDFYKDAINFFDEDIKE